MSSAQNQAKPSLHGVKIKTRKRVIKSQTKFEPEGFRDQLLEVFGENKELDTEEITAKLDAAGKTIDYRTYGEAFFELLVSGGLIAPGGILEYDEEYGELFFSLFSARKGDKDALEIAREWVGLISRLTRRYKYLERIFSDTAKGIVEYVNRYSEENNKRLAAGLGLLMARGLIGFESIKVLQKEHLNKDGYGLTVLTGIMRAYLGEKSIESLFVALEKIKADSLLDFFPFNKRMDEYFVRHFEAEDMRAVIDYVAARKAESARDAVYSDLFERLQSGASAEDLAKAARRAMTAHSFTPAQMATLLWDAILSYLRSSSDLVAEQQQFIAEVRKYSDSLLVFTDSAKAEMALLQHLQKSFYEDASLMKFFASVVRVFYEEDVLSNDAILFWAKKGALSQGKSTFMKQMSKFIDYLEQQSE